MKTIVDEQVEQFCIENHTKIKELIYKTIAQYPDIKEDFLYETILAALKMNFKSTKPEEIRYFESKDVIVLISTTTDRICIKITKPICEWTKTEDIGIGKISTEEFCRDILQKIM